MLMTFRKVCHYTDWDLKKAGDDRANGAAFIPPAVAGRIVCDQDDCAAAFFFMDQRRAGHTVRVAGAAATRLREAMRLHPDANQLTTVTLANGSMSTLPTADLDLSGGYVSGGHVATALTVDVRNFRDRVRAALAADETVIGGDDE